MVAAGSVGGGGAAGSGGGTGSNGGAVECDGEQ